MVGGIVEVGAPATQIFSAYLHVRGYVPEYVGYEILAVAVGTSVTFGQILAFLLIGLIVPLVLSLLASALTKIVDMTGLGFINRLLGAVLGAIKYALVISLVIHFIDFADSKDNLIHSTTKGSSLLYYPIKDFSAFFYPVVKTVTEKFIETDNIQN